MIIRVGGPIFMAAANNLMYVGLPRDYSTGLIRMGARWYDPTIGRFTQADPSGQETNPYLYAAGNPVNNVDLTGLDSATYWGWGLAGLGVSSLFSVGWYGLSVSMADIAVEGSAAAVFWGGAGAMTVGTGIGFGIGVGLLVAGMYIDQ